MKKIMIFVLLGAIILGYKEMKTIKVEDQGILIETIDISFKENRNGFTVIQIDSILTNRSEKEISAIVYELQLLDEKGELIKAYHHSWLGENKALSQGQSVQDHFGTQDKLEKKPSSINIVITEVKDTAELPLVHLPLPEEYLYEALDLYRLETELPIKIYVRIDHGGACQTAEIEDEETIRQMIELFRQIKISKETDVFVTDNYNLVIFYFNDGTEKGISLNLYNLEIHNQGREHIYELKDFGPFWKACSSIAKEEE